MFGRLWDASPAYIGRHHAWIGYLFATHYLARKHQLPRRLMPFLDDAHRLGLLRIVGPVYQIRHAELQDHLRRTIEFSTTNSSHT